jgi:hypothetical protein
MPNKKLDKILTGREALEYLKNLEEEEKPKKEEKKKEDK